MFRKAKLLLSLILLVSVAALSGDRADASGMGFRFNRGVCGPPGAGFQGVNLISLPFDNPYANAGNICGTLGLGVGGTVIQWDPSNGIPFFHACGGAAPFALIPLQGVVVTSPTNTGGIVAGSHPDNAAITYPIFGPPGAGLLGANLYPVPLHSTAVNAQDICNEAGLTAGSLVIRSDCANALVHACGGALPFQLVVGEALLIFNNAPTNYAPLHF